MTTTVHLTRRRRWARGLGIGGAALVGVLAVTTTATVASATTTSPATVDSGLQDELDAMVAAGAPGVILLMRDGDATTELTSGFGDVAHQVAMRPDDHFKIASLTKTYTATVILQLVAEGALHLTDPVERWLPGLVPNGDAITVRHLLHHTSGLFDYEADPRFLEPYLGGDLAYFWEPRELVELAMSHEPLFAPGQTDITRYSNTNYVLAGLVIEAATGNTLRDEFETRLFEPFGLDDTSYPSEPGLPEPYAHGYMVMGQPPATDVTGLSHSMTSSAGAIVSTATDVADFYRALLSGQVLEPAELAEMQTTTSEGTAVDIPGQEYGLGIETFPTTCGVAWGHNGVVPGYFTFIYSSPDGEDQALMMVNHDASTLPTAAASIYFAVLEQAFCSMAA